MSTIDKCFRKSRVSISKILGKGSLVSCITFFRYIYIFDVLYPLLEIQPKRILGQPYTCTYKKMSIPTLAGICGKLDNINVHQKALSKLLCLCVWLTAFIGIPNIC